MERLGLGAIPGQAVKVQQGDCEASASVSENTRDADTESPKSEAQR